MINKNRKVRVLIVTHELSYTGAVYSAKRMCQALLHANFEVVVWSYQYGPFIKEFEHLSIPLRIIDRNDIYGNKTIRAQLKRFDLVIANTVATYAIVDTAKHEIPTIWYIMEAQNLSWQVFPVDIRSYWALRRAENIYAVSEYAQKFIVENYNTHVRVVHNCVDDEAGAYQKTSNQNNSKIRFLSLGTIEERKGFDLLIDAYLGLGKEERKQMEIHFAGGLLDEHETYYEQVLQKAKQEEGLFYHGEIQDRKKLLQLMADSDVVVVPSKDESCSLVVLEAAMMSKPIIISENVGAKYMIKPENGWVFKTNDRNDLSNVYRQVLSHKRSLCKMGEVSRRIYEEKATVTMYQQRILEMVHSNLCSNRWLYRMKRRIRRYREKAMRIQEESMLYTFDEALFSQDSKIALYAAGDVGTAFYRQGLKRSMRFTLWVDKDEKKHRKGKIGVKPVTELLKTNLYDYVYIAVMNKTLADHIKKELIDLGVDTDKILWTNPRPACLWNAGICDDHKNQYDSYDVRERGIDYYHIGVKPILRREDRNDIT